VQDDAIRLNPDFDFIKEVKPLLEQSVQKRFLSQENVRKAGFGIIDAFNDAKDIPLNINSALKKVSQGSFTFKIAHDDLDRLGNSIDRASYKILLGLVLASVVIGMSLIVLTTQSILTIESLEIVIVVYVVAVIVSVYSVIQLIRERDKR